LGAFTKTALKKVLGKALVTLPVFQTLIVEIEAMLNDRPLMYVSADVSNSEPLKASHLISGQCITSLPHWSVEETTDPTYGVLQIRRSCFSLGGTKNT